MTALTAFLLARIAEDEDVALDAQFSKGFGVWEYAIIHQAGRIQTVKTTGTSPKYAGHIPITHDSEGLSDSVSDNAAPHIARHDPARVLAECEAKRRIVEDAMNQHTIGPELDWVVRVLAAIYAGHPDYRDEWQP